MTAISARKRSTKAVDASTGQVYCSHGTHYVRPEGGFYKTTAHGQRRFVCAACRTGNIARKFANGRS